MIKIVNYLRARFRKYINEELWLEDYIKMGMKVGDNVNIKEAIIDYSHCWLIEIGNNVGFGPQAYLLAHDASTKRYLGYTKVGKIKIGNTVHVGARSIIMPGVTIGNNCIIGAHSVVTKSIPDNSVAVGVPAKVISSTSDYIENQRKLMKSSPVFDESYIIHHNINEDKKNEMSKILDKNKIGYII